MKIVSSGDELEIGLEIMKLAFTSWALTMTQALSLTDSISCNP